MPTLTKEEREAILTIADDEKTWTVFCDSRRFAGKLRKIAARWGIEVKKTGHGFEVTLPLKAVRFGGPRTPRPESESSRKAPHIRGRFGGRAKKTPNDTPEVTP